MNIFSGNGPLSVFNPFSEEEPRQNRSQIIHRVKNSIIALRTPDAELWSMIVRLGKAQDTLKESVVCIDRLDTLITPISKIRGLLRLTMMQKKLNELFERIVNSSFLKDYYESWSFLRQERAIILCGALVGIRVIECNLVLDYGNLQEQPLSVDLSLYVKLPTVSAEEEIENPNENDEKKKFDKERKSLLDQNNYLEERIRQLETNLEDERRKLEKMVESKSEISFDMNNIVSYRPSDEREDHDDVMKEMEELKKDNENLSTRVVELVDSLKIAEEQVSDKAKVCTDLYEKLRLSEECIRKLEDDFLRLKKHYDEDKQFFCDKISKLETQLSEATKKLTEKREDDDVLRSEFQKKCDLHNDAISILETKQRSLSETEERLRIVERELNEARRGLQEMPFLKDENLELKQNLEAEKQRADEYEKVLKELGGSLSESKLRMVELTEELLPLSDAQWAKDSDVTNCTSCSEVFTITKRKHHCRMSSRFLRSAVSRATQQRGMYENPYINRFKARSQVSDGFHKKSTGLTGLFVNEHPHRALTVVYGRILRALEQMPADAAYRKYTEQIVKQRLALVQAENDIQALEKKIGMGQIEEVIEQAELELETTRAILESKAWEPLVEGAPKNQWTWPV
ncbi:unnamed protein product [Caenorhabditis bovis]|uniref:RUN domain-containing protein n=1 Tax=Caenorhabditis bovis TaxID=2654633 RepID=A0A8S1EWB8_9PELO|nr:unnamed protein product [Caenorhabditis bovis]